VLKHLTLSRPLVSLDVETTGINPRTDRIVQLGVVKVYPPELTVRRWMTLVNPGIPIPKAASEVHGITDATVAGAPSFGQLASRLLAGLSDCDICGYNVNFDLQFLRAEFARVKIDFTPAHVVDSFRIFQHHAPRNLAAAVQYFLNEERWQAHDAIEDAIAALRVLDAEVARYQLPTTIPELAARYARRDDVDPDGKIVWRGDEACINFGKHRGTPLSRVDPDYLRWIVNADFPPDVKRLAQDALNGKFPTR
jgi:DNA polymerase-3 subunit epsilon